MSTTDSPASAPECTCPGCAEHPNKMRQPADLINYVQEVLEMTMAVLAFEPGALRALGENQSGPSGLYFLIEQLSLALAEAKRKLSEK